MRSLRARLFAALACSLFLTGSLAGLFAFKWAFDEAIELQDGLLLQVGALAIRSNAALPSPAEAVVDPDAKITVEELGKSPVQSDLSGSTQSLPNQLPDGLQIVERDGIRWRVLVRSRADGKRIAVGQPTASRDEIARDSAIRSVLPLLFLFPILMLLVGLIIRISFRSVSDLALELDAKAADNLETLPLHGMPAELVPFVISINRLLQRIGLMFDHQRRFIAAAAHELRTPITALSLQAENLGHLDLSPEAADRLDVLRQGIRRIAHLLEQLLAASKYEDRPLKTEPVTSFDTVLKAVLDDHREIAAEAGVQLCLSQVDEVAVRAAPVSLVTLLRNLVDNAIRYSPNGGRVDLSLSRRGGMVDFVIEDAGPGIPDAELEHIFEPFMRSVTARAGGSGLGLTIVRGIVLRAGGKISMMNLRSTGRTGLKVNIVIPLASEKP